MRGFVVGIPFLSRSSVTQVFHLQTGSRIGLAYAEMRPRHMVEAMRMLQDFGIEMRD